MMKDSSKSQAYVDNGLSPLLDFIRNNGWSSHVHAIEMFNEPEWMIEGGSGVTRTTELSVVQNFISKCNSIIKDKGFKATVGSASLKWSCTMGHWCVGDWWG
jgi:hypothetical protein